MTDELFIKIAKTRLMDYLLNFTKVKFSEEEYLERIRMTWYNYTAGNYKAMFCVYDFESETTPELSNRYFEVTYITKDDEMIIDEYLQKIK